MTQGICRNAGCSNAANATPVDRYPGPGEYCPECGELLEELPAPLARPQAPSPKPFGGLTALEALQQFDTPSAPPPRVERPRARLKPVLFASAGVGVAAVGALFAFHPPAIGHPSGDALHVCRSSISQRFANDVVAAYRAKSSDGSPHVELQRDGGCDVRFSIVSTDAAAASSVVGRDAIVVVVNPENRLAQLTPNQLRAILTGDVTNWSQLGAGSGPIDVVLPDENSDEDAVVAKQILQGAKPARTVRRIGSSADVVALVSGTKGRNAIGVAAFSGAGPAKVVRLGAEPPPSALSIAQGRYPLIVAIAVEAAGAAPPADATNLIRFARSDDAQTIAARDGLVPRKGY
jgi:hypothetical protein